MKSFKITQSITDRQDASLGLYFKDVSKQPMIDINKEIELTRRIKAGDQNAVSSVEIQDWDEIDEIIKNNNASDKF
jgi:RNA polymerase primary sigma factor